MNDHPSFKTRLFTFFLAAQFLNVQIQTAFATEAITASSPEVQRVMQQFEDHLSNKLAGKTEKQMNRMAYQLYKLGIKIRNKVVLQDSTQLTLSPEEKATIENLGESRSSISEESLVKVKKEANREKVIAENDAFLSTLGTKTKTDGTLSKASFKEFNERLSQLKTKDLRGPASAGRVILKVIYCLLILTAAVALFYTFGLMLFFLVYGGTISIALGNGLVIVLIAGLITGAFFGIRAVILSWNSTSIQKRMPLQLA